MVVYGKGGILGDPPPVRLLDKCTCMLRLVILGGLE